MKKFLLSALTLAVVAVAGAITGTDIGVQTASATRTNPYTFGLGLGF